MQTSILLAQELVKGFHLKTGSPKACIKLYIFKAFDSIAWEYIILMLHKFGFERKFIHLVKQCISTPTFAVLINGIASRKFSSSCGHRQGDTLSPILFVLAMEGISLLLEYATIRGELKFYYTAGSPIFHLIFVDDLLLFCRVDANSIKNMEKILIEFGNLLGLKANMEKSHIFLGGSYKPQVSNISTFTQGD